MSLDIFGNLNTQNQNYVTISYIIQARFCCLRTNIGITLRVLGCEFLNRNFQVGILNLPKVPAKDISPNCAIIHIDFPKLLFEME